MGVRDTLSFFAASFSSLDFSAADFAAFSLASFSAVLALRLAEEDRQIAAYDRQMSREMQGAMLSTLKDIGQAVRRAPPVAASPSLPFPYTGFIDGGYATMTIPRACKPADKGVTITELLRDD